jgi:hypothetical protein
MSGVLDDGAFDPRIAAMLERMSAETRVIVDKYAADIHRALSSQSESIVDEMRRRYS